MQISCEKCSTTYTLDDHLLPPGGAPVQCTRCGHVFLAIPAAEQRRSGTQIFGRVHTPEEEAPRAATQMFGAVGTAPQPAAPPQEPEPKTQMFGRSPAAPPPQPEPEPKTQMFGRSPAAPPPEAPRSPTQMFGAVPEGAALPKITFGGQAKAADSGSQHTEPSHSAQFTLRDPKDIDPGMAATQLMEEGDLERVLENLNAKRARPSAPEAAAEPQGAVEVAQAVAPEQPEQGARPLSKVELPPEAPAFAAEPITDFAETAGPAPSRWGRRVVIAAVVLGALAGIFVGYRTVQERMHAIPPEAVVQRETALVILRRDDADSMQRALAQLEQALMMAPGYLEARADVVMVLALQADDAKAALSLVTEQQAQLEAQMATLRQAQTPSDWQNRVNVMSEDKATLATSEPLLRARAKDAADRLEDEFQRLTLLEDQQKPPQPQEVRTAARAKAMYFAIRAEERALAFVDQYRSLGSDAWADLAVAEYALGPRAPAALVARSSEALAALRESDSSLVRAHVLYARLAMRRGHPESAVDALNVALSLTHHPLARELLAAAQAAVRASPAQQSPGEPPANAAGTVP